METVPVPVLLAVPVSLAQHEGSALPDIVCRCKTYQLRTRFYKAGEKFEHEILIEPPQNPPRAAME